MSNEKVAATFHGDRALEMTILAAEKRGFANGYAQGKGHNLPPMEAWSAANAWQREAVLIREATGEHTKAKLADNPYGPLYANEYMRTLGPSLRKARRPWSPTHRELAISAALGLLVIIAVGWLFCVLG